MSLINQMLKDIEKRSRAPAKSDAILSGLGGMPEVRESARRIPLIVIAVSASAALLFWALHKQNSPQVRHLNILHHEHIQSVNALPKTHIGFVSQQSLATRNILSRKFPAELSAVTVNTAGCLTQINFVLNNDALYRVGTNNKNQLIITLENVHSTSSLPSIRYENTAIKHIDLKNNADRNLSVILTLLPNTDLDRVVMVRNTQSHQLEVALNNKMLASLKNTAEHVGSRAAQATSQSALKKVLVDMPSDQRYQRALNLLSERRNDQAIAELTRLIKDSPRLYDARKLLAELYLKLGMQAKAEKVISAALSVQPDYAPFVEIKARILAQRGNVSHALRILEESSPSINQYPEYYALLAAFYQRSGNPAMAESLYKHLLQLHPDKSSWWVGLGIALDARGQHAKAQQAYRYADQDDNLNPQLRDFVQRHLPTVG